MILEYIRSSIEIIMSLKIEDLERDNPNQKMMTPALNASSQVMSVTSSVLGARVKSNRAA